jgi:hypothetical protein
MNRTEALEVLRETLADKESLAIALLALPGLAQHVRRLLPPACTVVASFNPEQLIGDDSWELDGDPARLSATGRPVELARVEAIFRRAAAAYALAHAVTVEVRVLSGDALPGADDASDDVQRFGQGNGVEVDLTDYEPWPESLEPVPQEEDEMDMKDPGEALKVQPS